MATTAAGWLKPGDLSRRAVAQRALQLLGDFLDEEQRAQAERFGGFAVHNGGRVFWIPLEGTPWCAFGDDGRLERYCITPDEKGGMPEGDICLTYLLWIQSDPDGFLTEANVLQKKTIEWPDSDAELVRTLAELTQPRPARPRPRPKKKGRRPRPALQADAGQIRELFLRHGKTVPEDVIAALTRS